MRICDPHLLLFRFQTGEIRYCHHYIQYYHVGAHREGYLFMFPNKMCYFDHGVIILCYGFLRNDVTHTVLLCRSRARHYWDDEY